jgi:hypothetical protein
LACQPILAGSYLKTCKEFLASGDRIGAYCKNRDGFHIAATSPRVADCPHLAFSNIDGKIVCEAATDARPADDAKPSAKAKAAAPVGKVGKGLASPGGIAKQERIGAPPDVPIVPASMAYAPPLAASGLRLHACQTLKGKWCGKSVADQFCTTQGYVQAQTFDTGKERTKAQTFNGKVCDDEKCRVFVRIVCVR